MPFKSKAQRRWMYANDPEMAERWSNDTPKGKKLPEKVKKQQGGPVNISQFLPQGYKEEYEMPQFEQPLPMQATNTPFQMFGKEQHDWETRPVKPFNQDPNNKIDPYFALRGATTGLSWLSGMVERNRQNQYRMQQEYDMNRRDPLPAEMFQPSYHNQYFQQGGRLVDRLPSEEYKPLRSETLPDGTVRDYFNMTKAKPVVQPILRPRHHSPNRSKPRPTGVRPAAPLSMEDLIYMERRPELPPTISQPPVDVPQWASRGEYIHRGQHMAGEIMYPNRDSKMVTDPGLLNTADQDLMFQFRDDFGKGEMVPIKQSEIQKFFGTGHSFQDADPAYSYEALKSRAITKKLKKGGMTKFLRGR